MKRERKRDKCKEEMIILHKPVKISYNNRYFSISVKLTVFSFAPKFDNASAEN